MRPTRSTVMTAAAAAACGYTLAAASSSTAFANGVASQLPQSGRQAKASLRGATGSEELRATETQRMPAMIGGAASLALGASLARRLERRGAGKKSLTARKATITATIEQGAAIDEEDDVLVKKTSVLVMGATGTLGRQVVRQLLNAGFSVRCIIRNRADRPYSFLVDWGASVVEGNFFRKESLPSALVGIHTVFDCSTARAEENIFDIDWDGKKAFIQCCEKMNVQRYMFVSIKDCETFQSVPMMQIKYLTEQLLAKTKMRHTIFRCTSFMQPLIQQYAIPVLDDDKVWGDDGKAPGIAYIDSTDAARMLVAAATKERTVGKTVTVSGPKIWKANDIIDLCCELSGKQADINVVNTDTLTMTKNISSLFKWTTDVAERLDFVEMTQQSDKAAGLAQTMSQEDYLTLGLNPADTRSLETYIKEFCSRVLKKLTGVAIVDTEAGEVDPLQLEFERKLEAALKKGDDDKLPEGQPAEQDVYLSNQRNMADRLQAYYEDQAIAKIESEDEKWFGWTSTAEFYNARAAMFGFFMGIITEYLTGVSVSGQIDQLVGIFSPSAWND